MNTPNPFAPPGVNVNDPATVPPSAWEGVPPSVIVILSQTRPWLRLMLGLMVTVMGLAVAAVTVVGFRGWFQPGRGTLSLPTAVPLLLAILVYVPPAIYLGRSAQAIRRLQVGGGLLALEDTLRSQRSFWRYLGILALALIAVYAATLVLLSGAHGR
jgi:hypothetical protein